MPTMSKLFAAVLVAVVGYFAADKVGGHLPEEMRQGALRSMSAFFGLFVGWRFLGPRVREGTLRSSIGLGISASILLVIVCLIYFSGYEMIKRAMRKAYGGNPFEGLLDMVNIGIEFTDFIGQADVIAVLVLGGIGVGVVVHFVARRWS